MGRGFVESITNFVNEFLYPQETANARSIPYMEGEYWVDAAEEEMQVFSPFDAASADCD